MRSQRVIMLVIGWLAVQAGAVSIDSEDMAGLLRGKETGRALVRDTVTSIVRASLVPDEYRVRLGGLAAGLEFTVRLGGHFGGGRVGEVERGLPATFIIQYREGAITETRLATDEDLRQAERDKLERERAARRQRGRSPPPEPEPPRTWTDIDGRQIEARWIETQAPHIIIELPDGARHPVAIERLSDGDQEYVRQISPPNR